MNAQYTRAGTAFRKQQNNIGEVFGRRLATAFAGVVDRATLTKVVCRGAVFYAPSASRHPDPSIPIRAPLSHTHHHTLITIDVCLMDGSVAVAAR